MARANRILAVLRVLVNSGDSRGLTRGEIMDASGLPPATELLRPVRDLRKPPYGLTIECIRYEERGEFVWRYRIAAEDYGRARTKLVEKSGGENV